ncbi:MAG: hypothetical protein IK117_00215 [Bacteroidales bacterium]|nr:hypothetical protein [Bacteroidales bacterium]
MNTNKIEIYQTEDGKIQLDVRLENTIRPCNAPMGTRVCMCLLMKRSTTFAKTAVNLRN